MQTTKVYFQDWGLIDYQQALAKQKDLFEAGLEQKESARKQGISAIPFTQNHLIFCEHPPVYTLGRNGKAGNLLVDATNLAQKGIDYYQSNRGGDITYHGPGQIVGYPILDLDHFFNDIHRYLRYLEEAVILTLQDYGIIASRFTGLTGVWIDSEQAHLARKICAMGVHCSRWMSMHGFALNINTDLSYFQDIVPCGIQGKSVTSLAKELGAAVDITQVKTLLKNHLAQLFNMELIEN